MKLGLTLPSFIPDPDRAVAVAVAAEAAGVDGVFVYDHLFRVAPDGRHRPALECVTLLGAVSVATRRITIGTLVARVSLRPSASLVPRADDRSTLLTTAGMQPQMPYFLGREPPPAPLTTTAQKCFRTPDIDEVGLDTYHLTFFEMMGTDRYAAEPQAKQAHRQYDGN